MNKLNIISFKFDLNDRINILIPELTIDYYTEVEIQYIRDKKTFSIGSENIFAAISDLINATPLPRVCNAWQRDAGTITAAEQEKPCINGCSFQIVAIS